MIQQKKNTSIHNKFSIDVREMKKQTGKKMTKNNPIKSKIVKNLSEMPIFLHNEYKQNQQLNFIQRPQSQLVNYETLPCKNEKENANHKNSQFQNKRKSIDSVNKKIERDSLTSKYSTKKRMSRNTKSIEDDLKFKMIQDRKRSNLSCNSAIEENRYDSKPRKKVSNKVKRNSTHNLNLSKHIKDKSPLKELNNIVIEIKRQKSKSKNKIKKSNPLDKSKANIVRHSCCEKNHFKKKQSSSTSFMMTSSMVPKKSIDQKKKPKKKKKQVQKQYLYDGQFLLQEQVSHDEYPINKYGNQTQRKFSKKSKKSPKNKSNSKSKSRSRSRRNSNNCKRPSFAINYNSCLNIINGNNEEQIFDGSNLSYRSHTHKQKDAIKIIENDIFEGSLNPSINMQEIRHYESNSPQKETESFLIQPKISRCQMKGKRMQIFKEISQDYVQFNQVQLSFLSAIILIQRKWRQISLYKNIKKIAKGHQEREEKIYNLSFEKANEKKKDIFDLNRSPIKQSYKEMKQTRIDSVPTVTLGEKTPQELIEIKQNSGKSQQQRQSQSRFDQLMKPFQRQEQLDKTKKFKITENFQEEEKIQEFNNKSKQSSQSMQSGRYEFLQNQYFPNINYLIYKKQELREQMFKKIYQLNQQMRNKAIVFDQFLTNKQNIEDQYNSHLKQLSKSKKDIKKGYLKFIDSYKCIKHNALRKVSSEAGLMAIMYKKIYNFDQKIEQGSDSSQSIKKLSSKLLIRKEMNQTQKIETYTLNVDDCCTEGVIYNERKQTQSSRQYRQIKSDSKYFKSKKENNQSENLKREFLKKKEFFKQSPPTLQLEKISPKIQQNLQEQINQKHLQDKRNIHKQQLQKYESFILQDFLEMLTSELFEELIQIDERRQMSIDIVPDKLLNVTPKKEEFKIDFKEIQKNFETDHLNEDDLDIIEQQKVKDLYRIEGIEEKIQKHQRKRQVHHLSPMSSHNEFIDVENISHYSKQLFEFLKKSNLIKDLVKKLNRNQGFTPIEYLKFLRDFDIPDDDYEPIISNETFILWEEDYNGFLPASIQQTFNLKKQSLTVFHRSIFETIINYIEEFRPCGQRGVPFPWQTRILFINNVKEDKIDLIFKQVLQKIETINKLKCGIIDEKHLICNEQDLEKVHEQNQDKIIDMLEKQLWRTNHDWYEVEQHTLEIKLDIESEIYEYLILEALDELLCEQE